MYLSHEPRKAIEFWNENQEFCKDKGNYIAFLANCKGDLNHDINNVNKIAHYLKNNNEDNMQYLIVGYISNKSFMTFLMAQDIFLSIQVNID